VLVQHFLQSSARRFPDKTALICGSERLSYGEVDERSNRLAHALRAAGVRRGDRVAICLDNTVEAVLSIFGALKADAAFLLLNPTIKLEKLAYVLNNSRALTLITHSQKLECVSQCSNQTPYLKAVCVTGFENVPCAASLNFVQLDSILQSSDLSDRPPLSENIDLDLAALLYTSGSTASPKGVMLSHRNICSAAESVTSYLENGPDDIILNVLPLFFGYGLYQVLMTFHSGGTVILERSMAFPHLVLERIAREHVTGMAFVPQLRQFFCSET
jgi:acyl-CoA synthetase (AMP-forming)/AMP-acid ligase II